MVELEKLGKFFTNYSVQLHDPVTVPTAAPLNTNHILIDLDTTDEILLARRGLSWIARMGYWGFSIGEENARKIKRIPKIRIARSLVRVRPKKEKYFETENSPSFELKNHDSKATSIIQGWMNGGRYPKEIERIFEDPLECQERLSHMLGYGTYQHHRNKDFGSSLEFMRTIIHRNSELMRIIRDNDPADTKMIAQMIDPIATAISGGVEYLKKICDESEFEDRIPEYYDDWNEDFNTSATLLAKAAFEVRRGYKKNGWEVRDGVVKKFSYPKLLRVAHEMGADPGKTALLIAAHFGGYHELNVKGRFNDIYLRSLQENGFFERIPPRQEGWQRYYSQIASIHPKQKRVGLGLLIYPPYEPDVSDHLDYDAGWEVERAYLIKESHKWGNGGINFRVNAPKRELPYVTPQEYHDIGRLRIDDFRNGHHPYQRERKILKGLLRISLNRKNFNAEVDRRVGNIDWHELDREIWRIKSCGEYDTRQVIIG